MKNLRKITAIVLVAVMCAFTLVGCTANKKEKDSYTVGVIQYVSHSSLDNCYAGVEQALKASAIADKITIERQIGSDNSADADVATYAAAMVEKKCDLIIAIATPAAAAAYAATEGTDIPVIFCAVSDPVEAELVQSMDKPGEKCSGTSDVLDLAAQVDLIQSMQPNVKSIGILYTTSEPNSISNLTRLKEITDQRGLTVDAVGIQNDADIPAAAAALCSRVDCVNNFTDNKVVNNLSVLLDAADSAGIPVYGSEVEQVKKGCLAAVSIDYVALGKVTGEMAVDALGGADVASMAVKTITDATPVVNTQVLTDLGMTMPEAYNNAETVAAE